MSNPDGAKLHELSGTVVLVGAGKMGGALLEGWFRLGLDRTNVVVLEPAPSINLTALSRRGLRLNPDPARVTNVAAVVLAVKPQTAPEVLPGLAPLIGSATVVVSIMAGRTLDFLRSALPGASAFVRAMPNTPAAIGRGITVAVPLHVSPAQRDLVDRLLAAAGVVEWITDELLMDAVTAVSGSGPAYVFLLAEALARAGKEAGLRARLAATLARETIAGSGELLHRSAQDAATLRANVTSPGGTTAAALDVLMGQNAFQLLMTRAVVAATKRSRELAG